MQAVQPTASTSTSAQVSSSAGKPDRLYVGNLSPTVDEYTLIQIFSKYGKIVKLDFMFHKSGVLKGKPRGFAFIEMSSKDDALKALVKLHDRLLRGRKLVVTYANSAPPEDYPVHSNRGRRPTEAPKTTTLSLLKQKRRPLSAAAQIAAMEAKLAVMAKRPGASDDYVPGQSPRPEAEGSSVPGSPSGRETDLEDELGLEEGGKAADKLKMEIEAELGAGAKGGFNPTEAEESGSKAEEDVKPAVPQVEASPTPRLYETYEKPQKSRTLEDEERTKRRDEVFKQGLAGLPKKPAV